MSTAIKESTFNLIKNQIGDLISKENKFKEGKSYHEFEKLILNNLTSNLNSAIEEKSKAEKVKNDERDDINKRLDLAKNKMDYIRKTKSIMGGFSSKSTNRKLKRLQSDIYRIQRIKDNFHDSQSHLDFNKSERKLIEAQEMLTNAKSVFSDNNCENNLMEYINNSRIHFPEPLGNLSYSLLELFMEGDNVREQREQDLKLLTETMNKKDSSAYAALKAEFDILMKEYHDERDELEAAKEELSNEQSHQDYDDFIAKINNMKNKEEYKILSDEFRPKNVSGDDLTPCEESTDNIDNLKSASCDINGEKEIISFSQINNINKTQNSYLSSSNQNQYN